MCNSDGSIGQVVQSLMLCTDFFVSCGAWPRAVAAPWILPSVAQSWQGQSSSCRGYRKHREETLFCSPAINCRESTGYLSQTKSGCSAIVSKTFPWLAFRGATVPDFGVQYRCRKLFFRSGAGVRSSGLPTASGFQQNIICTLCASTDLQECMTCSP